MPNIRSVGRASTIHLGYSHHSSPLVNRHHFLMEVWIYVFLARAIRMMELWPEYEKGRVTSRNRTDPDLVKGQIGVAGTEGACIS